MHQQTFRIRILFSPQARPQGRGMTNEITLPLPISPYLTLNEAATYARCSKRTVQRWLNDKKLNRYGHGRRPLIHKGELAALLLAPAA